MSFNVRDHAYKLTGTDLLRIRGLNSGTVLQIVSEVGVNLNAFPTGKHFSSWLCLSPNRRVSGGKVLSSHTNPSSNRAAAAAFRQAAVSVQHIDDLVKKFDGDERLIASNRLIDLYNEHKSLIIKSLIDNILPDNDPKSYRRNLYIAFTLARIRHYWEESKEQLEAITRLKRSSSYANETFRKRVDEAINNHKPV